jgi:hypothetical protein
MTDNTARAADSVGTFVPRALVPVTVGRSTIKLYPIIDGNMATHEQAHAFHINKTALLLQYIDLRVQLDALGHQLNLSATVEGVINDWLRYFYDRWSDFSVLEILSFHNTRGDEVNDTTTAADPSILLPVVDGAYPTRTSSLSASSSQPTSLTSSPLLTLAPRRSELSTSLSCLRQLVR